MITVYDIAYTERKIIGATARRPISGDMRRRIMLEYGMSYNAEANTYTGDPEHVWNILQRKYPIQTKEFKSFNDIYYHYKFGSVPASSLKFFN